MLQHKTMVCHYVRDGRHRYRQDSVSTTNTAMSLGKGRHIDVGHVEVVKTVGNGDHIHNGVHGPHLVEVHFLDGQAVCLGLRLGHDVKDAMRCLLGARREVCRIDDGRDVRWRSMLVMMVVAMVVIVSMVVMMVVAMAMVMAMVVVVMVIVFYIRFCCITFCLSDLIDSFDSLRLGPARLTIVKLVYDARYDSLGRCPSAETPVRTLLLMVVLVVGVIIVMMVLMGMVIIVVVMMVMMPMVMVMVVIMMMVMTFFFTIEIAIEVIHIVIVGLVRLIQHYVEVTRIDGRHLFAGDSNLESFHIQAVQSASQACLVRSEIEQRTHDHIAADTTRAFQIQCLAHVSPPPGA